MKLQIGGRGTREQLIERLQEWHRKQFNYERRSQGSNFSLLEVELPPSPPKDENNPEARRNCGVSPTLLSPLKTKPRRNGDGTPVSILSTAKNVPRSSEKKRLNFSIFNQTKIIPPRGAIRRRWAAEDGIDIDAESEDELDAAAADEPEDMGPCAPAGQGFAVQDEIDAWLMGDAALPTNSPALSRGSRSAFDDELSAAADESKDTAARPSAYNSAIPCALSSAAPSPAHAAAVSATASAAAVAPRPLAAMSPSSAAARSNGTVNSMFNYATSLIKQAAGLGVGSGVPQKAAPVATAGADMAAIEENLRNMRV